MKALFPRLRRFFEYGLTCEQGTNLAEMALIVSLVGLGAVAGTQGMAHKVQGAFGQITSNLANIFDDRNFGAADSGAGGQAAGSA
ncbi:MAG: hypothetical protein WCC26_21765, partial [Terracidiphilus sp.]